MIKRDKMNSGRDKIEMQRGFVCLVSKDLSSESRFSFFIFLLLFFKQSFLQFKNVFSKSETRNGMYKKKLRSAFKRR